jgi:hypothetical protein
VTARPRWVTPALIAGSLLLLWAIRVLVAGGFAGSLFGFRVSAESANRPVLLGGLLVAAALTRRHSAQSTAFLSRHPQVPAALAAVLAMTALFVGVTYGAFVAGGPDPYGYVSQADLWRAGTLTTPAPLSAEAPWFNGAWAFTPLGYRPAAEAGFMVPLYPPGLPMAMAAGQIIAGETGGFLVVPLLGAGAVWLTFLFARMLGGAVAGVVAAAALLASPPFLMQLVFPMSDVPAMAWWLLAVVLALRRDAPSLIVSGLAAAIAVLTRPNLAVLGPLVAVLPMLGGGTAATRVRRLATWGVPALAGPVTALVLNARLYGSPLATGYGDLSVLYSSQYVWTNVRHYASWLWTTQTAFIAAGVAAAPLLHRRGRRREAGLAAWALAFALAVVLSYLWYLPFDQWMFLRFLLPAFPMLLATAGVTVVLAAAPRPRLQPLAAAAVFFVLWTGWWRAEPAFSTAHDMARFRIAGEWARTLPENAVVISTMHSGSVRYYGHRLTLRHEWLSGDQYKDAMAFLVEKRRPAYAILDREELATFEARYAPFADVSWLQAPPLAILDSRVYVYSVPLSPRVRTAS